MSAAEKLRALAVEIEDARGFGTGWEEKETLAASLPQIVAVVEAAQTYIRADKEHQRRIDVVDIREALSALDEALNNGAEASPTPERTQ